MNHLRRRGFGRKYGCIRSRHSIHILLDAPQSHTTRAPPKPSIYNRFHAPPPAPHHLALALPASALAQQPPSAVIADPAPDPAHPPTTQSFQIPSHGEKLNALTYIAAGPAAHPTIILLHGFPGNERNLDLAQAIRRAGWNVLFFDYRGSWGTSGSFSFSNSMQDTKAASSTSAIPPTPHASIPIPPTSSSSARAWAA